MKKITYLMLFVGILSAGLLAPSCSKNDDGDGPSGPQNFDEFEFSGLFTGTLTSGGSTSPLEGYVTIEENGATNMVFLTGSMTGTSTLAGDVYNVTVTSASGPFQDISNLTGVIDIDARTIYLTGQNPDGTPFTAGGNVPPVTTTGNTNPADYQMSAVAFSHQETCVASITINGTTISGLQHFYQDGGVCDDPLQSQIVVDYDNKTSQLFCQSGVLQGLDGNPLPFTLCSVARFILEKNTEYTYTVNWSNGEVTTGTFTSPDGGRWKGICLSNNGAECDENGGGLAGSSGNPRFNLSYTADVDLDLYVETPNGTLIYYGNPTGQNGQLDVDCTCGGCENGHAENIFWTNGPSGQYKFYVNYYGSCSGSNPNAAFTIKVMNGSQVLQTRTGTLSEGQTSQTWTYIKN